MTETDDAARAAEQIAAALSRLRGPRPPGPPFGEGRFGPPWGHRPGHGERHPHHGGGRSGDHGPMGRFAARFRLLDALAAASIPLSVSELADLIGVDQPRASRLVQAAVAEGLVRREANAVDARRTDLLLTEQGRAIISQVRGARTDAVTSALEGFTNDERDQLAALLSKLAASWPR